MDIHLTIPFASPETAALAHDVLNVDKELKGSGVQRKLDTEAEKLLIHFHGEDLKRLRVCVNSFINKVLLVLKTVDQFKL